MNKHVVILGGGLAGLSCGYELMKAGGHKVTVLEREPFVGGMASSFVEEGDEYWAYDFGPHRFHSKDENLIEHVREILGTNVVMAQRGFQASSKVISTADEILQDLVNLKR